MDLRHYFLQEISSILEIAADFTDKEKTLNFEVRRINPIGSQVPFVSSEGEIFSLAPTI